MRQRRNRNNVISQVDNQPAFMRVIKMLTYWVIKAANKNFNRLPYRHAIQRPTKCSSLPTSASIHFFARSNRTTTGWPKMRVKSSFELNFMGNTCCPSYVNAACLLFLPISKLLCLQPVLVVITTSWSLAAAATKTSFPDVIQHQAKETTNHNIKRTEATILHPSHPIPTSSRLRKKMFYNKLNKCLLPITMKNLCLVAGLLFDWVFLVV